MNLFEKLISSESKYKGKVLSMREDLIELPNGATSTREVVEHNGAVGVVPLTQNNEIIFVRQFRSGIREITIELPAGKLEKGEDPLECGKRELKEETGFDAKSFTKLTQTATSPAILEEIIHIYLAQGLTSGETNPDDDEFVETVVYSINDAVDMVKTGKINDGKTIIGILLTQLYLKEKGADSNE